MINLIVWVIGGGVLGAVLSRWLRRDRGDGVVPNVAVGAVVAALFGWYVSPYLGTPVENRDVFSLGALFVALLGALAALLIFNAVRANRRSR